MRQALAQMSGLDASLIIHLSCQIMPIMEYRVSSSIMENHQGVLAGEWSSSDSSVAMRHVQLLGLESWTLGNNPGRSMATDDQANFAVALGLLITQAVVPSKIIQINPRTSHHTSYGAGMSLSGLGCISQTIPFIESSRFKAYVLSGKNWSDGPIGKVT